jgi:hypothetical protein
MLIKVIKENSSIYDDLNKNIYNNEIIDNEIILNCLPIKFINKYWLITNLTLINNYIEDKVKFQFIVLTKNKVEIIKINNIISIHDNNYDNTKEYDAYFDTFANLLLIKYNKKVSIYSLELNHNINYDNIIFKWFNNENKLVCAKINSYDIKKIHYEWLHKYIIYPPVPYIIIEIDNFIPYIGTIVLNNNNLIGIVSHNINNNIYIIPLFTIQNTLNQLNNNFALLNFDIIKVIIDENNNLYGNYIKNNYYNITKGTIITEIDNLKFNSELELILEKKDFLLNLFETIPIKSYIWFFKKINKNDIYKIKIKFIKNKLKLIKNENNYMVSILDNLNYEEKTIEIKNNKNVSINISNLNYINYNNKYILEINENILLFLKELFILNNKYINIIKNIFNNKYSINKILLGIKFTDSIDFVFKECNLKSISFPKITLIKKFKNINNLIQNKSKKELKTIICDLIK